MTDPLRPGAVIGILGGGQLGRMLAVAAARLGYRTHVYEPGAAPPAADVVHRVTTAGYGDAAALTAFAGNSIVQAMKGGGYQPIILLVLAAAVWLGAGFVARRWMKHDGNEISPNDRTK